MSSLGVAADAGLYELMDRLPNALAVVGKEVDVSVVGVRLEVTISKGAFRRDEGASFNIADTLSCHSFEGLSTA